MLRLLRLINNQLPEYIQTKCWHCLVKYASKITKENEYPSQKKRRTLPSRSVIICTIDFFDYQQKHFFYMQNYTKVSEYFPDSYWESATPRTDSTSKHIWIALWAVQRVSCIGTIWLTDKDIKIARRKRFQIASSMAF